MNLKETEIFGSFWKPRRKFSEVFGSVLKIRGAPPATEGVLTEWDLL
jgi:hypothetical protein